ncbi:EAL domain-containing protein [Sulfuricurvum sp.]|uniref:putative bifunctional diguanylate cyclase/phosphodiesterase n=1 Tax=Sulfuricurvum sp. TaxID=2025608 RepID=UPI00260450AA|nr:EAL domain-containing protein [Sulfuricurvum sp.]MDD2267209.1 EAL domain-containing protein [Sulfuricurvum sp.]MDD2782794.1 EAL domain-containing protein [Sulfuricurvum sp.]
MLNKLTLRNIANISFITILVGSIIVGTLLFLLLRDYEEIISDQQLSKSTYESLFVLKYDTERLLTTSNLEQQKKRLLQSQKQFQNLFRALSPKIKDKQEWIEFKNIILSELEKVQVILQDDLFSKQNMMEKSLLRRLGEGLNANENSSYYIKIRDLNSNIEYLKQYEDFLLDELYTFQLNKTVEADKHIDNAKNMLILVTAITFFLLVVLAYIVSQTIKTGEKKLLGIQGNLKNALFELEDKQKILVQQRDTLDYSAHYDSLTGIPNRLHFVEKLKQLIERNNETAEPFAVWFIDLDRFKEINDSFGHSIGDGVLQEVAKRLENAIGKESVARFGGDEFAIIVENAQHKSDSEVIIKRFLDMLDVPMDVEGYEIFITCSAGASFFPNEAQSAEELLRNADSAMYQAKNEGKNTYQFYTEEMTKRVLERITLENSLRKALSSNEFVLYYQPQVDMSNEKIIGFEALIRWNNPEFGIISPIKFIPIAEDTGLIIEIGEWVIEEASRQMMEWKNEGFNPGYIAVNISGKQLIHGNLEKIIPNILKRNSCPPALIELELTESIIMNNPEYSKNILAQLAESGFKLAIDDFGTGYSSLAYLKNLPINKLKIDKSFVDNLPEDQADCEIVKSIIHLAKGLKLNIVAEGIETKKQGQFILKEGCRVAQGYYYFKPLPAEEVRLLLTSELS